MNELLIAAFVLLGVVVTAAGTYLAVRRTRSGNVDTSDAADLWKEGAAIRTDLAAQIVGLREQLKDASGLNTKMFAQLTATQAQLVDTGVELRNTTAQLVLAHVETQDVRRALAELNRKVADVHVAVATGNRQTLGALADNIESRRIALIPPDERSSVETEHITTVGGQVGNELGITEGTPHGI